MGGRRPTLVVFHLGCVNGDEGETPGESDGADAPDVVMTYDYDAGDRLEEVIDPIHGSMQWVYDDDPRSRRALAASLAKCRS